MAQPARGSSLDPAMSLRPHPTQQMSDGLLLSTGYPTLALQRIPFPAEQLPSFSSEDSYTQGVPYHQGGLINPTITQPLIDIQSAGRTAPGSCETLNDANDQFSWTPPDVNIICSRPRAATDHGDSDVGVFARPVTPGDFEPTSHIGYPVSLLGCKSAASQSRRSMNEASGNDIFLRVADPEYPTGQGSSDKKRISKHPAKFHCSLCPKRFTRAYNMRSHLRSHADDRPFVCTVCGKTFARQHDRKRHEDLHSGEKKFVCRGDLKAGGQWGCGRRFARADGLGRHFSSAAWRSCIEPLLLEETLERQNQWGDLRVNSMSKMVQVAGMGPGMYAPPMSPISKYYQPSSWPHARY